LQFAEAGSAATLPQQEKSNSADLRPCRVKTCGGMLEVSRDAVEAEEEQLGRCAAENG
jgi:hypothetical protein